MPTDSLDREFLEELLDGDREFAEELFETYFESADSALVEAGKLLESDANNSFRPFHTLKGASASVGLTGLQEMAREFEVNAKAGDFEKCIKGLPQLAEAVEVAKKTLKAYLETLN